MNKKGQPPQRGPNRRKERPRAQGLSTYMPPGDALGPSRRARLGGARMARQPNNWRPISTSALGKADRAQEAHLVHARRAAGLPARHLHPAARHRSPNAGPDLQVPAGGILGMFNMFSGGGVQRMAIFALNIMPYISASIIIQLMTTVSRRSSAQEGRRGGPQEDQPVHPLSDRGAGAFQAYGIASGSRARRASSSIPAVLPHLDRDHADRRHHVPDVARRADHQRAASATASR
jgi:hypothetical protein